MEWEELCTECLHDSDRHKEVHGVKFCSGIDYPYGATGPKEKCECTQFQLKFRPTPPSKVICQRCYHPRSQHGYAHENKPCRFEFDGHDGDKYFCECPSFIASGDDPEEGEN